MLLGLFLGIGMFAQSEASSQKKLWSSSSVETRFLDLYGESPCHSIDFSVAPGCTFANGLSLRLPLELNVFLLPGELPVYNTYRATPTLGLNAGYNLLDTDKWRMELNLTGGLTLEESDMDHYYADLGLRFGGKAYGKAVPYLSIGTRYCAFQNRGMQPRLGLYFSFGVWLL